VSGVRVFLLAERVAHADAGRASFVEPVARLAALERGVARPPPTVVVALAVDQSTRRRRRRRGTQLVRIVLSAVVAAMVVVATRRHRAVAPRTCFVQPSEHTSSLVYRARIQPHTDYQSILILSPTERSKN